ncbi:MAG: 30S ribosomal protein S25e [Candidatus Bathyarchaeota archaeon]|nr:30S ribosomal protein S25e [Candidatus Bathyarchaeota archaeon]
MGGKKRLTLSQAEKALMREAQKKEGKKEGKPKETARVEKKVAGVIPPSPRDDKIIKEIQKMKVLTPYAVASRFNLRLSIAKDFLEELHRQGVITYVSGGRYMKIYKPI